MLDLTFLNEKQVYGDIFRKKQLEIFRKYGMISGVTDFAILLGCSTVDFSCNSDGTRMRDRGSYWWLSTNDGDGDAYLVDPIGERAWENVCSRRIGARPATTYTKISNKVVNEGINKCGIKEVEFGEYPQWVVIDVFDLEKAYNQKKLKETGKIYTTDSASYLDTDVCFSPMTHIEYEYNGCKYIRFVSKNNDSRLALSNYRLVQRRGIYWLKVKPIIWLVDEKNDIALSKYILFSGVQFKSWRNYEGDFSKTGIKQFMDDYLAKEIICNNEYLYYNRDLSKKESFDIDSIFEEAIRKMNEINKDEAKVKVLK